LIARLPSFNNTAYSFFVLDELGHKTESVSNMLYRGCARATARGAAQYCPSSRGEEPSYHPNSSVTRHNTKYINARGRMKKVKTTYAEVDEHEREQEA